MGHCQHCGLAKNTHEKLKREAKKIYDKNRNSKNKP